MSYLRLRGAVERLAANASEQSAWLDWFFSSLTNGASAEGYGNFELIELFYDDVLSTDYLVGLGQMSRSEEKAARDFWNFLDGLDCEDEDFWERTALLKDPRWESIRRSAKRALLKLPDKSDDPEWVKQFGDGSAHKAIPGA